MMGNKNKNNSSNTIANYFYNSWTQTAGEGWVKKHILVSYIFSILFAGSIILYSFVAGLHWSWIQIAATAIIAWDLGGGVLGYNHKAIKIRQANEKSNLHFFHHNLQHIHPLILIFFNNEIVLLCLTIYWFITFIMYVEFLEISPKTKQRKISRFGETIVIVIEIAIALVLIIASFFLENISVENRLFGVTVFSILPVFTLILIRIPITFQRTASIMMVAAMIIFSMFIEIPEGFGWFIPIYYLKLLTGFTAKEDI